MNYRRAQDDPDDEEREQLRTFPQFLAREWTNFWLVWILALIFAAVIVWNSFH